MPLTYTTVPHYFLQDDPATDPNAFDFISTSFGIIKPGDDDDANPNSAISGTTSAWLRLRQKLAQLNGESGGNVQYKLLFMGRHGEGVHNVAERRYGTEAWDANWSRLDGDEHGDWVDAKLTARGEEQARQVRKLWKKLRKYGVLLPKSFYSSPLRRCLQTVELSFAGLDLPGQRVVIKEGLRETMGVHTCDRRSSKARIAELFEGAFRMGEIVFEEEFAEEDGLWRGDHRETEAEIDVRLRRFLDDVFANDGSEVISLTSHGGAIASILRVLGHMEFGLQTGGVIPVLVRAEKTDADGAKVGVE